MFIFGAGSPSSYSIARSLRFNSADSAYLNRSASAGNRRTFTWSGWAKRASFASGQRLFTASDGSASSDSDFGNLYFNSSDQLAFGGQTTAFRVTSAVYRDPSAWYHIVLAVDTTNATAADRVKLYVNGAEVTAFGTSNNPTLNLDTAFNNSGNTHYIGRIDTAANYFDGYMAEVHYVDGTALTPSSFGQTDPVTGQWLPKAVSGVTYGTNGFYLPFSDNSGTTSTTLGKDGVGSNNWTPTSFSVTAGAGNDSLTDTPTNNHCVLTGNFPGIQALSNGGLTATFNTTGMPFHPAAFSPESGKWYWEVTVTTSPSSNASDIGIVSAAQAQTTTLAVGGNAGGYSCFGNNGNKYNNNSSSAYGSSYTTGDVVGVAWDADNRKLFFSKNGTWQASGDPAAGTNAAYTSIPSGPYAPAVAKFTGASGGQHDLNFGQRAFAYTPPSGFSALCTSNLPTPSIVKPSAQFDVETFTGTGATRSKTGLGFQPDLVWFKGRSGATDHALYDSTRGVQKQWESNTSTDETTETTGLTAFNSDGYTIGSLAQINTNTATYVAWMWKEGATPGLDVVTYTGAGAGTVAHNLGVVPKFIIVKARTTASTDQTAKVYHASLANTEALDLGATSAKATGSSLWNSTTPTSSVFSVGSTNGTSGDTYVAYAFSEVAGFSRFGSYTGNASTDGPFVHCGFRPRFVMVKRTDSTGDWYIWDTARDTYNASLAELLANSTATEAGTADLDTLSNGFKLRATTAAFNASGGTFVFAAFSEAAFKYANAR